MVVEFPISWWLQQGQIRASSDNEEKKSGRNFDVRAEDLKLCERHMS